MTYGSNLLANPIGGVAVESGGDLLVSGDIKFTPDNTHDIGASGASRVNDIYMGGTLYLQGSGAAAASGSVALSGILGTTAAFFCTTNTRPVGLSSVRSNGAGNISTFGYANFTGPPNDTHNVFASVYKNSGGTQIIGFAQRGEGRVLVNGMSDGQYDELISESELVTIDAAATTTATIQWPAGCAKRGISIRAVTAMTTATDVDVGDGSTADKWFAGVSDTPGTTSQRGLAEEVALGAAESIVFTPDSTPGAADGQYRLTIHYSLPSAPTS